MSLYPTQYADEVARRAWAASHNGYDPATAAELAEVEDLAQSVADGDDFSEFMYPEDAEDFDLERRI